MSQKQPDITVFFIQHTRSIRPVWLLEELGVPYKIETADFSKGPTPAEKQAFKDKSGSPMGRYPCIRDGDLVVHESGAITQCTAFMTRPQAFRTDARR
jgi:glutathione S-transferase